jgi:hypothetical protein
VTVVTGYSDPSTATTLVSPRWLPAANIRFADASSTPATAVMSSTCPRSARPAPTPRHAMTATGTDAPRAVMSDQSALSPSAASASSEKKPPKPRAAITARPTPARDDGPGARATSAAPASASSIPARTTAAGTSPAARSTITGTAAPSAVIGAITLMLPTDSAR